MENPAKSEVIQNKVKQTNLERYGFENAMQSEEIREKVKQTNLEKYGFENAMQSEDIKDKVKRTNLEKYGTESSFQREDVKQKIKQTNLEKYGVDHYYKLPEVAKEVTKRMTLSKQEKLSNMSDQEKIDYYANIREKREATNLERYGHITKIFTDEEKSQIRLKIEETSLKKFNTKNAMKNNEIKQRALNTIKSKKEENAFFMMPERKKNSIFATKEKTLQFLQESNHKYNSRELSQITGYAESTILQIIHSYELEDYIMIKPNYSFYEKDIIDILNNMGITNIEQGNRKILESEEIDIYLPDYKIGIEFNGSYWHSHEFKSPAYHQQKSLLAESKGIFLYHIFEYEWINPEMRRRIINQLRNLLGKNENKIYARKCDIRLVEVHQKQEFLNENHVQGAERSVINLGLYYEDQLASIMSFSKPRFTGKVDWELSRFCSKSNYNVIGAASKLFKYFVNNYLKENETVVSYSHITKTKGNIYSKLGFELHHISRPGYVWWLEDDKIKTRYQTMMKNERISMSKEGYRQIYDCGNKVWIYKK